MECFAAKRLKAHRICDEAAMQLQVCPQTLDAEAYWELYCLEHGIHVCGLVEFPTCDGHDCVGWDTVAMDGTFDGSAEIGFISHARVLLERMHYMRCSHPEGLTEHPIDWTTCSTLLGVAMMNDVSHFFALECAANTPVWMLCDLVRSYITDHIRRFHCSVKLLDYDVDDTVFDERVCNLKNNVIDLQIIELVSHNGCLHPVGELCCCNECDDYCRLCKEVRPCDCDCNSSDELV